MFPLEWSHHFLVTDYASLAELEGKKYGAYTKVCKIALKFERYFNCLKGIDLNGVVRKLSLEMRKWQ